MYTVFILIDIIVIVRQVLKASFFQHEISLSKYACCLWTHEYTVSCVHMYVVNIKYNIQRCSEANMAERQKELQSQPRIFWKWSQQGNLQSLPQIHLQIDIYSICFHSYTLRTYTAYMVKGLPCFFFPWASHTICSSASRCWFNGDATTFNACSLPALHLKQES